MRKIRKKSANWGYNFLKKEEEIFYTSQIGKKILSQSLANWRINIISYFIPIIERLEDKYSLLFYLNLL
jgi:hypothetical protein